MKGWKPNPIGSMLRRPVPLAAAILLGLNLALALWGALVVTPETEQLQAAISRQKILLESRGNKQEHGKSKEQVYLRNDKLLQDFFAKTPDHRELPALLEELFAYAKKLELSIERINYQPKHLTEPDLVQYGLTFQLTGSYDQIKHMIFLLEHSPRTITLNKLQFHRRSAQSSKVVLGMDLDTYFDREGP